MTLNCIKCIISNKNFTVIKDLQTGIYWAYSYKKPIAYYDGKLHYCSKICTSYATDMHRKLFENYLKENVICA